MPKYIVRPGHSFRMDANTVKGAGEVIDLDASVAAQHASAVEAVPDELAPEPPPGDAAAQADA